MSFTSIDTTMDISSRIIAPYRRYQKKAVSYIEQVSVEKKSVESISSRLPKDITKELECFNVSKAKTGMKEARTMCLTNDNTCVIIGGFKDIIFFDLEANLVVNTIKDAHQDYITSLTVTKDDGYLISTSYDRSIKIWNLEDINQVSTIAEAHPFKVLSVILANDEKYFISSSRCDIGIWSFPEGNLVHLIKDAHTHNINKLAYDPGSNIIVSISADQAIRIWKFGTWELLRSFEQAHTSNINNIALTPNGESAITTGKDGSISIWNLKEGKHVQAFTNIHRKSVNANVVTPCGKFVLCCSADGTISVCDLENKIYLRSFVIGGELVDIKITNDYKNVVKLDKDGMLCFCKPKIFKSSSRITKAHENAISDIKITSDDKYLVSSGLDGFINVWEFKSKKKYHSFQRNAKKEFLSIDISPNGEIIASGCSDALVDLWNIPERKHVQTLPKHHVGEVMCVRFNADGSKIVSCCTVVLICVWDFYTKSLLFRIEDTHHCFVTSVLLTKDSQTIISASYDRSIKFWDVESRRCSYSIDQAHDGKITNIKLTRDGHIVISASYDKTIKLWNSCSKNLIHTFSDVMKGQIFGLKISRDSKLLLAGDDENCFAIFNLELKQHLHTFVNEFRLTKYVTITSDLQWLIHTANDNIEIINNPIQGLTVLNSNNFSIFSPFRYLPLDSFLQITDTKHRKDLITAYPNFRVFPHGWSWFHIIAIYSDKTELLNACFNAYSPFEVDLFGWTPLHYLLNNKKKNLAMIGQVLDQLQSLICTHQKALELLDSMSDIITNLLELKSPKVVEFLRASVREPKTLDAGNLEIFGDLKDCKSVRYYFSSRYLYTEKVQENLGIIEGNKKLVIRVLPFRWNYTKTSDDMYNLVKTLEKMTTQNLFETKAVSVVIHYLWHQCYWYYVGKTIIFSGITLLVTVYAQANISSIEYELVIFFIGLLFYAIKIFIIYSMGVKNFIADAANSIDFFAPLIIPLAMVFKWFGSKYLQEVGFSLMLAYCYFRWISLFRVFKNMRKLARMIFVTVRDIRSILFILTCIVFGLSFIFYQFNKDIPYQEHLTRSYNLLYTVSNIHDYSLAQAIYLVILTILVTIIMFNTLIAVISDTFAKLQSNHIYEDSQELLYMIEENIAVSRQLNKIKKRWGKREETDEDELEEDDIDLTRRQTRRNIYQFSQESIDIVARAEKKQYMFFVEEEREDGQEGPVAKDEWQGVLQNLKKDINKTVNLDEKDKRVSDGGSAKKEIKEPEKPKADLPVCKVGFKFAKVVNEAVKKAKHDEEKKALENRLENIEKMLATLIESKQKEKSEKKKQNGGIVSYPGKENQLQS